MLNVLATGRSCASDFPTESGKAVPVDAAFDLLADHPLLGREAEDGRRELLLFRGKSGYVAKYRWVPVNDVELILAVRHQLEAGYKAE